MIFMSRTVVLSLVCSLTLIAQTRTFRPITVQQKVALVIGNASYARAPLVNPVRDAQAVAAELRGLGFTVLTGNNLSLRELSRQIDEFAGRVRSGDLALFYFSGHGMQIDRENYLLPIDFEAAGDADVPYTAYAASRVRDKLEGAGARLRILILDACRDNPYKSSRGGPSGLAPMGTNAEGTLIAFATGDNNVASDGPGQTNGLFTQHLLAALREPGLELHDLFKRVKEDVYYGSNKRQNPFTYDDVAGSFYFRPVTNAGSNVRPPSSAADADAWESIRGSSDASLFEAFLKEYPASQYAGAARIKLATLKPSLATTAGSPAGGPAPKPESAPRDAKPEEKVTDGSRSNETKVNPKDGLTYVWIQPGTFTMGCSQNNDECGDNAHNVTITKGFWLGQTPVTQEAYQRVKGTNPSHFTGPNLPVEQVNWNAAQGYCEAVDMRLPTEAEWEYAARAGSKGSRYGDLDQIAWYADNSGKQRLDSAEVMQTSEVNYTQRLAHGNAFGLGPDDDYAKRLRENGNGTHPVGQKQPNAWGLYDMLGNVDQWTSDWFVSPLPPGSVDPAGPTSGQYRVARGGSWYNFPSYVRASARARFEPVFHGYVVGFRCLGGSEAPKPEPTPAPRVAKPEEKVPSVSGSNETKVNPKDGLIYVWIPPGTFMMGCSPGDGECADNEKPAKQVTISRGFWMGQTAVTQEAYQRVTGTNPSHFKGAKLPVETVTWKSAESYCQAVEMRLPTEAEWEYAARAGSTAGRYGDIDAIAWYGANSGNKTHEVAQKQPNTWGLYDMLGNVWQWTSDWYADRLPDASVDPTGPTSGQYRVRRGGSWNFSLPRNVRASDRTKTEPEDRNYVFGFRCLGN
jgi:formylglycine-generating enzyme required for sulfatase activity